MSVASFVTDGPVLLAAPVAAAAGLVSFLSPCVLPLVPGYLSYVAGLSGQDLAVGPPPPPPRPAGGGGGVATVGGVATAVAVGPPPVWVRGRVALGAALFVLGFSAVFVSYGAVFGGLGRALAAHQRGVAQALGVVTILLGLAF
ncbi:MAG TPA: cytochrome c biogenesis protein CcdA, partial [Frankiaceae bacterium]|nr:cytochrome c biogenesis protein CcdA [Frankiaceae bacterium]